MGGAAGRLGFRPALRAIGASAKLVYNMIGPLALAGALWWFAAATLVLLGPATLTLHRLARSAATGEPITFRELRQSWRTDFCWSSIHSLGWLAGWLAIMVNAQFYSALTASSLAFSIALPFFLIWLALGFFLYPAALARGTRTLRSSLRAALELVVISPGRTLAIWAGWSAITAIAIVIPIFLLVWPSVIAAWGQIMLLPSAEMENQP